jgi:transposase
MAHFPNNSRAREKPDLIPISKRLLGAGKPAVTTSLSCIGSSSLLAPSDLQGRVQATGSFPPRRAEECPKARSAFTTSILARQAFFLFLRRPEELDADEQDTLALLRLLHAEVDQVYELVQQFVQMVRTRTGEQLDGRLERVKASQIRELQGFVAGVERDKAAVVAGLTLPYSNRQTQGQVNKLKSLKRQMYGRATFEVLRKRVLHAA